MSKGRGKGSIDSLFGMLIFVFVLVAISGFMSGNILQGLGGLGAVLLIALGLWLFKSISSGKPIFPRKETTVPRREILEPLSSSQKEELIQKVGTRCSYPNCPETTTFEVHHIIPRTEGGTNKENNLIVLCPTHHTKAHSGEIPKERLKRYSVSKVKLRQPQ